MALDAVRALAQSGDRLADLFLDVLILEQAPHVWGDSRELIAGGHESSSVGGFSSPGHSPVKAEKP
jgi:hypothetical protein